MLVMLRQVDEFSEQKGFTVGSGTRGDSEGGLCTPGESGDSTAQTVLGVCKHMHAPVGLVGMVESQTDPFYYWYWIFLGLCKAV